MTVGDGIPFTYRKPRRKDWLTTLVFIAIYVTVIGFSSFYLLLSYWYVWVALVIGGLLILVAWHAKTTAYLCPRCGYEFEISVFTDFLSLHGVTKEKAWKYLKCPKCHHRSRMRILVKKRRKDNNLSDYTKRNSGSMVGKFSKFLNF